MQKQQFSYDRLYALQHQSCFYCYKHLDNIGFDSTTAKRGYTRDHFFPRSWGNGLRGNTVLSCDKCNRKKGSMLPNTTEILKFLHLYEHFDCGTILNFEEFLYTQRLINFLGQFCNPCVDTRRII